MNRHHVYATRRPTPVHPYPCALNGCRGEHVSVYTDDEQRARDERLILGGAFLFGGIDNITVAEAREAVAGVADAIIAAADPPEVTR